jgi:hypothetical protein
MAKDYKDIARKALRMATDKTILNEGFGYPEGMMERIHPTIEKNIIDRKTAIGDHPALPKGGVRGFDQKLLLDRFVEVVNRYKEAFGVEAINDDEVNPNIQKLLTDCRLTEKPHKKALVELAIKMVREEFDMDDDMVDIEADIVEAVSLKPSLDRETADEEFEREYESHDDIDNAEKEVMKRRMINALIQGASMKTNHMFNLVNDELMLLNPTLSGKYKKLMSAADYSYFKNLAPESGNHTAGGVCNVESDGDIPKIVVEALTFPVLIHELVKGVMELVSLHGFTEDDELNEFVMSQADFTGAEPSDMRMGPALWGKLMSAIEPDDLKYKHHIYHNIISMPVDEFNDCLREIFAGTKRGKQLVLDIVDDIKSGIELDEMADITEDDGDNYEDIQTTQKQLRDLLNREDFDDILGGMIG